MVIKFYFLHSACPTTLAAFDIIGRNGFERTTSTRKWTPNFATCFVFTKNKFHSPHTHAQRAHVPKGNVPHRLGSEENFRAHKCVLSTSFSEKYTLMHFIVSLIFSFAHRRMGERARKGWCLLYTHTNFVQRPHQNFSIFISKILETNFRRWLHSECAECRWVNSEYMMELTWIFCVPQIISCAATFAKLIFTV